MKKKFDPGDRVSLPVKFASGRLRSKGVSFYERVGILLVKVYEREEESLISVCKKSQKGLQMHLMPVKKSRKCSCF